MNNEKPMTAGAVATIMPLDDDRLKVIRARLANGYHVSDMDVHGLLATIESRDREIEAGKAFHNLAVAERNKAWAENERLTAAFVWSKDPLNGVCWARHAVFDTQGCVVVEAEKPSEGESRWVQFATWGVTLTDCVGSGWEFAEIKWKDKAQP